jgi:hypothetical protein
LEQPRIGQVAVHFTLRSTARTSQSFLIDLAVHFVKANGNGSPKVLKLKHVDLPPRELATKVSRGVIAKLDERAQ